MTLRSRIFLCASAISPLLLMCACSRAPAEGVGAAPTVSGDRIMFPVGSPQRAAIAAVAAEPHAAENHQLSGRVVWDEEATVRIYSPIAGRVGSVLVALGDRVDPGTALVRIDSPDFGQAQADVRKANADRLLADRTLARMRDLFEHGAVARKDVELAENAETGAASEQQRAVARLKIYGGNGSDDAGPFILRSPLAGTIVEKNVGAGQEVRPDQQLANAPQLFAPLCVVSDPTHLRVLIDVSERDLAVLKTGMPVVVRSMAIPDRTFDGRIDWVSDSLDPSTHMVTVRARVENPARLLKAEMFVTVEMTLPGSTGVDVPIKSVFMKDERHFVYVEEAPGTYGRREVELGAEQAGMILVRSGLAVGQRVVTEGGLLLDEVQADARGG